MSSAGNPERPKLITIDGRAISHPQPGGFKTYSVNLVKNLPVLEGRFTYQILLDRPAPVIQASSRKDMTFRIVRNGPSFLGVAIRENISVPYRLNIGEKTDLAHFPNGSAPVWASCPYVVTIHDTLELMSQPSKVAGISLRRILMHLYNRYNQIIAAHQSRAIITVSHHSKNDISRYLHVPEDKIFVIYEAPNEIFLKKFSQDQVKGVRQKFGLDSEYILGIGSSDPRKNIKALICSYNKIESTLKVRYKLVLVMTHHRLQDELIKQAKQNGLLEQIIFLHSVSNQDLALLYHGATLFVFPSLYEGFGLPVLEAMACGVPVIASRNSSIPEIAGDAALLVDNMQSSVECETLTEHMTKVLVDSNLQKDLVQRGINRARLFSWQRCAKETTDVYARILSSGSK